MDRLAGFSPMAQFQDKPGQLSRAAMVGAGTCLKRCPRQQACVHKEANSTTTLAFARLSEPVVAKLGSPAIHKRKIILP
jgi:hypothetical protein